MDVVRLYDNSQEAQEASLQLKLEDGRIEVAAPRLERWAHLAMRACGLDRALDGAVRQRERGFDRGR